MFDICLGGRQGECAKVHHHRYNGWAKNKGKLLFRKGEIYCGGKARGTLAHRWMSTPSLVEFGSMHTKLMVDLDLKNIEIFDICSGFLTIL